MRSLSNRYSSRAAFTLVELLVVILIVGILVAVAVPSFLGQAEKAKESGAKQELAAAYKSAKAAVVASEGSYSSLGVTALVSSLGASEPQLSFVASATEQTGKVAVSLQGTTLVLKNIAGSTLCTLTAPENAPITVACAGAASSGSSVTPLAPVNTALPVISGFSTVGGSLTVSDGSWNGAPTPTYSYAWQRRTPGYSKSVIADAPYSYYRMDTAMANAVDSSGNGRTGYNVGAVAASALSSEPTNAATTFNGINSWMEIPSTAANFSTGVTFEAWIKTSDTGSTAANTPAQDNVIVGDTNVAAWFSWGVNGGKLSYRFYNTGVGVWQEVIGTSTVADGQWHHVSSYHDTNGTVIGWVDGTLEYSSGITYDPARMHPTSVGAGYGNGANPGGFFNGQIDEVAIWNYARNSSAHYTAETSTSGFIPIAGATASSYTAVEADRGQRLRVTVTATNPSGTSSASSLSRTVTP